MRKLTLLAVLFLFLLVPALITRAQKVSVSGNVYEKGTVKNSFTTPYGTINTVLPDDIRPGDVISGTVSYEPEGRREKDKTKNRIELLKYGLLVGRQSGTAAAAEAMKDVFILQNKPQAAMHGGTEHARDIFVTEFTVPADFAGNNFYLQLRDAQKNIVAESSSPIMGMRVRADLNNQGIQVISQEPVRIFTPDKTIYMSGELAAVSSSSTAPKPKGGALVYLNRTRQKELGAEQIELKLLASSPRQTVFSIPANIYGSWDLVFQDADKKTIATERIHVLQLEASCPKTNLMKGQSTVLTVKVMGLEGCPADYLRLTLSNTTSRSVQMGEANHEQIFIEPVSMKYSTIITEYKEQKKTEGKDVKDKNWSESFDKEFILQRPITALQTGNFNIDISLNYPSSVYNDPFRQQLEALKTTEQFKSWLTALNEDTKGGIGEGMSDIVAGATTNLEQARALAYNYARGAGVTPGTGPVPMPYPNSTLEAGRAAVDNAISENGTAPLHYEVIESALQVARQQAQSSRDKQMQSNADSLRDKLLKIQREMNDYSERMKTFQDIRKLFNDLQRAATNNMRISYDPNKPQQNKADSGKGNGTSDALTDGLMLIRYMSEQQTKVYTGSIYYPKKQTDALTDGLLIIRYMMAQAALTDGLMILRNQNEPPQTTDGVLIIRYLFGTRATTDGLMLLRSMLSASEAFRLQLQALQTEADFKNWSAALKKDLQQLHTGSSNVTEDGMNDEMVRSKIQEAIDKLPVCTSPGDLNTCKTQTTALLESLHIPIGASVNWLSSYEAFKSAVNSMNTSLALPYWDWELFHNGLRLIKRNAISQNNLDLFSQVQNAEQLVDALRSTSPSKDQLTDLKSKLEAIVSSSGRIDLSWNANNLLYDSYCLEKLKKDGIDPKNSMIAYLDPDNKVLKVKPEYQQQVLTSMKAVPAGDGLYQIQSLSAMRTPVSYTIRILPLLVGNVYDGDWWANELIKRTKADTAKGNIITTTKDSTGTWWIFYKDAKCTPWVEINVEGCREHQSFEYDSKTGKGEFVKDGKYFKMEFLPGGSCKKGTEFCTEMWQVFRLDYIYADKDCKKLISVDKTMGFSCQ